MARRKMCGQLGCINIVDGGVAYCPEHERQRGWPRRTGGTRSTTPPTAHDANGSCGAIGISASSSTQPSASATRRSSTTSTRSAWAALTPTRIARPRAHRVIVRRRAAKDTSPEDIGYRGAGSLASSRPRP